MCEYWKCGKAMKNCEKVICKTSGNVFKLKCRNSVLIFITGILFCLKTQNTFAVI